MSVRGHVAGDGRGARGGGTRPSPIISQSDV